jgi:hypothetical protein
MLFLHRTNTTVRPLDGNPQADVDVGISGNPRGSTMTDQQDPNRMRDLNEMNRLRLEDGSPWGIIGLVAAMALIVVVLMTFFASGEKAARDRTTMNNPASPTAPVTPATPPGTPQVPR